LREAGFAKRRAYSSGILPPEYYIVISLKIIFYDTLTMSSKTKTIQINTALLFPTSGTKTRKNTGEKKARSAPIITPNAIKTKLLERIKAHKHKNQEPESSGESIKEDEYTNEFNDSMAYLSSIAKNKKEVEKKQHYEKNIHNAMQHTNAQKTIKNHYSQPHVELELPEDLREVPPIMNISTDEPIMLHTNIKGDDVPYGCLKGGTKPTYKSWSKTQKSHTPLNIESPPSIISETARESRMKELKDKLRKKKDEDNYSYLNDPMVTQNFIKPTLQSQPQPLHQPQQPLHQSQPMKESFISSTTPPLIQPQKIYPATSNMIKRTIKQKYTLGKSKTHSKIGILIKDKQTRKRVLQAQRDMKKHPINDVKKYLREHGLMKVGSNAPNDIVRKIYESSMLAGDITNNSTDILLHNFIQESSG